MRGSIVGKAHLLSRRLAAVLSTPRFVQVRARSRQSKSATAAKGTLEKTADTKEDESSAEKATESIFEQAKAIDSVVAQLNKRYGKGSIMRLGANPQGVECIPSGALTLDIALGGGFPKGRIIEIFGPESSGKTTLALHAVASAQKSGGVAVFIDAEHAFEPAYSKRAGVDVDNLILSQPDNGEMALEMVDEFVRSHAIDIVVIDSVAALTPKSEIEGEIGQFQMGAQARLMSQALRKLTMNISKSNTTVIFINQLRQKIGVIYGNPEITTGGLSLKYYASVRVDVRRIKTLENSRNEQTGIKVKAKVVKNKVAPPFRVCEFDILFSCGISTVGCLLDAAEKVELVKRKGSWYSYKDENLGQGREKTIELLLEDKALQKEIEEETRRALTRTSYIDDFSEDGLSEEADDESDPLADLEPLP